MQSLEAEAGFCGPAVGNQRVRSGPRETTGTAPAVESTRRRTQGGKQDGSNGSRYDSHSGRELCPGETVGRLVRPPDGQIRLFC